MVNYILSLFIHEQQLGDCFFAWNPITCLQNSFTWLISTWKTLTWCSDSFIWNLFAWIRRNCEVCTTHNTFSSVYRHTCHIDPVCYVGFIQNCLASMSCGSDKVGWIFTKVCPAIVRINPDWLFTSRNLGADVKSFFRSWILIDLWWYNLGAVTLVNSLYPWVRCAFDNVSYFKFCLNLWSTFLGT